MSVSITTLDEVKYTFGRPETKSVVILVVKLVSNKFGCA